MSYFLFLTCKTRSAFFGLLQEYENINVIEAMIKDMVGNFHSFFILWFIFVVIRNTSYIAMHRSIPIVLTDGIIHPKNV